MRGLAAGAGASVLAVSIWSAAAAQATYSTQATYSLTATKTCLVKKGARFQSPQAGAQAKLPPAERRESLVGTLPVGNEPLFLYLAIAPTGSDAVEIRKALERTIVPNPTAANSWSAQKANAAWIVVSIAGTSPSQAAHTLVLSCLKQGKPPTSPTSYRKTDVELCIQVQGRAAVVPKSAWRLFLSASVPPKLVPRLLFAFTSTSANTRDGLRLYALFGTSHSDALSLRSQLDRALGGEVLGPAIWTGSKKNVAWAAGRLPGTTTAGIASGKRTLLSCLS